MSPRLPEAALARMGGTVERDMDQLAAIERRTTTGGPGGSTTTWTIVQSGIPCAVAPGGRLPVEQAIAGQAAVVMPWTLTMPRGTDIRGTDRIIVGGTRRFEVVGARGPRTYELSRRVIATEIT